MSVQKYGQAMDKLWTRMDNLEPVKWEQMYLNIQCIGFLLFGQLGQAWPRHGHSS